MSSHTLLHKKSDNKRLFIQRSFALIVADLADKYISILTGVSIDLFNPYSSIFRNQTSQANLTVSLKDTTVTDFSVWL